MKSMSVRASRGVSRCAIVFTAAMLMCVLAMPALALQPIQPGQSQLAKLAKPFPAPELAVQPELESTVSLSAAAMTKPGAAAFLQRVGGSWEMRWDRRADRPNLIQGSGVPLIPGKGNTLDASSIGLAPAQAVDMATVERLLREFITENQDLLGTDGMDFRLDEAGSVPYGKNHDHWFVEFNQYQDGVPVDRANLFFRISHGNIVQFGSNRVAPVAVSTRPAVNRTNAFDRAWTELAFPSGTRVTDTVEVGELLLLPIDPLGQQPGESYIGMDGSGYAHELAWRFVFRVNDDSTTYELLVNAMTGSVIAVRNLTQYANATVTGGIYPTTNTDPEVVEPMPFLAVSNSGTKITDVLGIYDYSGGTATTSLDGKYFRMSDRCGPISLSNSTDGNLDFGTSGGTDCTTPGVGGAGNTHASRSGFYHLTNINRKAITFFPGNSWLGSKVTANMNINDLCNAYWNGNTLNFFKSGGGCSNTGEIAAVFLHEWGHGMDTNSGGAASENGSGEAVGDTFAFLETKDACIGKNFRPGVPCTNCDATCTGVRDVKAFSTRGAALIAKPSTITAAGGPECGHWSCPYYNGGPYQGPMGYEGHCESYIASSANWDLTQLLVDKFGTQQGFEKMDDIWYGSLVPSKSAYRVASGGQCNVNAEVDGCGANNWYTVFLAADDDDGNLANGTPNACRIWDAFDAHGIACGARPVCSGDAPDFSLTIPNPSQSTCAPGNVTYTIDIGSQMGFSSPVTLSASGLPTGVSASFSPNPVSPGSSSILTATANGSAMAGSTTFTISGAASGSPGHSETAQLAVSVGQPAVPSLTAPADDATDTPRSPTFTWTADPSAVDYTIEIATDPAFATIVATGTPSTASFTPSSPLQVMTTHYWRVRANSPCGNSAMSATFSLTTGATFPEPYCPVSFPNAVEPITHVVFSGIDNTSSATVDGSPTLEDFLGVPGGAVTPGGTYSMKVEGNTAGNYTTRIKVYIDWNHNGVFDANEGYIIGSLNNSTGTDGKQVTANIAVPAGALPGSTRMRVIKKYNTDPDACNSAGWGQAEDYTLTVAGTTYTVGGTVSGLTGSGLALSLNGGSAYAISADGPFTFTTELVDGASYAVTVATQPSGQTCAIANGSGTIGSADVTDVAVTCVAGASYTVGGTVSGVAGSGLALKLNAGSAFPINANGAFTLPGALASGASYAVTLAGQPLNPAQTCSVANGSGTIGSANVTDVAVTCVTNAYTVGGSVSALAGSGLVLALNGSTNLPVSTNGTFVFPGTIASGEAYAVTVGTQPTNPSQTCTVANGSGTVGAANVTNITVACVTDTYTVGGDVSGLVGSDLVLVLNGSTNLPISANGAFVFLDPIASGETYAVTVGTQPTNPSQTCTVANGSGTVGAANVINVAVTCVTSTFTVGGTVTGLVGSGLKLSLNGGTDLAISGNGPFAFTTPLQTGDRYLVTITAEPFDQTCTVTNETGTIGGADVTDVIVTCTTITDRIFANDFEEPTSP